MMIVVERMTGPTLKVYLKEETKRTLKKSSEAMETARQSSTWEEVQTRKSFCLRVGRFLLRRISAVLR